MKSKIMIIVAILAVALWVVPASALVTTQTFPQSGTLGGQTVSGVARFIIDSTADTITVDLWDTVVNPKAIIQNISDVFFDLTTGQTVGTLDPGLLNPPTTTVGSRGLERTVNSNVGFTDGNVVATGWELGSTATGFHLTVLGTSTAPTHTIIGLPDGSGNYSNANSSIIGGGGSEVHNPFLFGTSAAPVEFLLSISGIDDTTRVTDVALSFGTTAGANIPIPPSALLMGSGLLGMGLVGWRRRGVTKA